MVVGCSYANRATDRDRNREQRSKPYQSKLAAVEAEIAKLRAKRPPVPYRQIARHLHERFGIQVDPATIFRFVKVRSKGKRSIYLFGPPWHRVKNSLPDQAKKSWTQVLESNCKIPQGTKAGNLLSPTRRRVSFTASEHYNLTRLTPEEAAPLEKKLDEELKGQS